MCARPPQGYYTKPCAQLYDHSCQTEMHNLRSLALECSWWSWCGHNDALTVCPAAFLSRQSSTAFQVLAAAKQHARRQLRKCGRRVLSVNMNSVKYGNGGGAAMLAANRAVGNMLEQSVRPALRDDACSANLSFGADPISGDNVAARDFSGPCACCQTWLDVVGISRLLPGRVWQGALALFLHISRVRANQSRHMWTFCARCAAPCACPQNNHICLAFLDFEATASSALWCGPWRSYRTQAKVETTTYQGVGQVRFGQTYVVWRQFDVGRGRGGGWLL